MSEKQPTKQWAESPEKTAERAPRGRAWLYFTLLLVVPVVLWTAALVVPFLPLATAVKVWLAPGFAGAAEVVFWVSAFFLGREIASCYRRMLDPRSWFRKDNTQG